MPWLGRDGPLPAGTLRSSRPRAPRPPVGLHLVPGPEETPARDPMGAQSPPVPLVGLPVGACCARDGWQGSLEDRKRERQTKTVGRRQRAHARGDRGGARTSEPSSRSQGPGPAFSLGQAGATSTCAGARGPRPPLTRRPPARRSARPGPPGLSRKNVQGEGSAGTLGGSPGKVWSAPAAGSRPGGGTARGSSGCDSRGFKCRRCLKAPTGLSTGARRSGSGNLRGSGFLIPNPQLLVSVELFVGLP